MAKKKLKPIHPSEALREEVLQPFGIGVETLAKSIGRRKIFTIDAYR